MWAENTMRMQALIFLIFENICKLRVDNNTIRVQCAAESVNCSVSPRRP